MSLATRCPACGTIFRVVQDQLRVSEGWVRCGQCQEVFHGIEALFDLDNDPMVAARRAATQNAALPTPARVFADQHGGGTISDPSSPYGSPASGPDYGGFTPAPQTPATAFDSPFAPTPLEPPPALGLGVVRATIAPRFAARLAEDAARAAGTSSALVPPPAPISLDGMPAWHGLAPDTPRPFLPEPMLAPDLGPAHDATPFVPDLGDPAPIAAPVEAPAGDPVSVSAWEPPAPQAEVEAQAEFTPPALDEPPPVPAPPPVDEPEAAHEAGFGWSTVPSMLAEDDGLDDARGGPPTLASMLPQDVGHWPPRRAGRRTATASASTELALVDRSKDPRFLREARRGARWHRPWVRAGLGVALLLLILAAAGQVAWPQRDMLAARWPVTLPAWNWVCAQAGCRITAPRSIASLALDGSSLTRTDTDRVLLFSADLHNRSEHAVAVPWFDVTFLDLNGAIVARKVLAPAQIGIRQASLPADGELHVHARLQVGSLAANGFQADLFYP